MDMVYREMYEIEVRHEGLNKYRHILGSDQHVVQQKANAQELAWDEMWERKLAIEETRRLERLRFVLRKKRTN